MHTRKQGVRKRASAARLPLALHFKLSLKMRKFARKPLTQTRVPDGESSAGGVQRLGLRLQLGLRQGSATQSRAMKVTFNRLIIARGRPKFKRVTSASTVIAYIQQKMYTYIYIYMWVARFPSVSIGGASSRTGSLSLFLHTHLLVPSLHPVASFTIPLQVEAFEFPEGNWSLPCSQCVTLHPACWSDSE